jgi:hypothetical protein
LEGKLFLSGTNDREALGSNSGKPTALHSLALAAVGLPTISLRNPDCKPRSRAGIMPQYLKTVFDGALSGIEFVLGTAFLGFLVIVLHVALPYLIPITIIIVAVAFRIKSRGLTSKQKALPPGEAR